MRRRRRVSWFVTAAFGALAIVAACCTPTSRVRADEPKQITFDGVLKRNPVFAPDGKSVVYAVEEASPRVVLVRLDLSDGKIERLHPKAAFPEMKATFAADGSVYAYLQLTGNDMSVVQVRRIANNEEIAMTFSKPLPWDPVITPDGKAVVLNLDGRIALKPVAAGDEKIIVKSAGLDNWPHVRAGGKALVFSSNRDGDYEVYSAPIDGSAPAARLTDSGGIDIHPAWSPDGGQIAFTSARDGNYEIYAMHADGSHVRRLTNNAERDDFPAWHPDGKSLVLVCERNGQSDLFLLNVP